MNQPSNDLIIDDCPLDALLSNDLLPNGLLHGEVLDSQVWSKIGKEKSAQGEVPEPRNPLT